VAILSQVKHFEINESHSKHYHVAEVSEKYPLGQDNKQELLNAK
jgi:hypothetical protein